MQTVKKNEESNDRPLSEIETEDYNTRMDIERMDSEAQTHVLTQDELPKKWLKLENDYQRLTTDFDNFKKRTQRDAERMATAEKEKFIVELLPVIDNLERALASESDEASGPLSHGVKLILQQLGELLNQHGIEAVEDLGLPFDPHRHEAVTVGHDPTQSDGIILEVTQRGFMCGDYMVRPAKVIVNALERPLGDLYAS